MPALEQPFNEVVAKIEQLGGNCSESPHQLRSQSYIEKLFKDPAGPDDPITILVVTGVNLDGTQITAADLKHLKRLAYLEVLILDNTQITDAGLEDLKELTNLASLTLTNTQVRDEGVKTLRQVLPNCKIQHEPSPLRAQP